MKPCGTHAAYMRHMRNSGKACDPCKAANATRTRHYIRTRPDRYPPTPETLAKLGQPTDILGRLATATSHHGQRPTQ